MEFSQAMEFRSFFSLFSAGDARLRMRPSQNFPNPNGDRPVPIGRKRGDDRILLKNADISVVFSTKLNMQS